MKENFASKPGRSTSAPRVPRFIENEAELDALTTSPSDRLIRDIPAIRSPLLILGAGGKMGPSIAVLAQRAAIQAGHPLEIFAASRFRDASRRKWLETHGVRTLQADLYDPETLRKLPDAPDIVHLVGQKFGTQDDPSVTWAANTLIPDLVAKRFARSRIAVVSTGNVYPLVPVSGPGALESLRTNPVGEYAHAALARERIFEWNSRLHGTAMIFLRLNYATELRYGIPHDIAWKVWKYQTIDLSNGWFNCIWQGEANEAILRSLPLAGTPPAILNLTGPEKISVRAMAQKLGTLMKRRPRFQGKASRTALLSNASRLWKTLGPPGIRSSTILRWTAHWVMAGRASWNKPTHFETRDGRF